MSGIVFNVTPFLGGLQRVDSKIKNPDLRKLGERIRGLFQQNIEQQRLEQWPPLSPGTVRQRIAAGYGAGPPLIRSGSLRESIEVLSSSGREVDVGVADGERAAALDSVRPFIGFVDPLIDQIAEPLMDDIFGVF